MYFSSKATIYLIYEVCTCLNYCMLILCSILQPPHIPQEESYTKSTLYTWTGLLYFLSVPSLSNPSKEHVIWNVVMNAQHITGGDRFVFGFKVCTVLRRGLPQPLPSQGRTIFSSACSNLGLSVHRTHSTMGRRRMDTTNPPSLLKSSENLLKCPHLHFPTSLEPVRSRQNEEHLPFCAPFKDKKYSILSSPSDS